MTTRISDCAFNARSKAHTTLQQRRLQLQKQSGRMYLWIRGCRSHFFRLRLCSYSKIFEPGSGSRNFFWLKNPTPVQTPAAIDPTEIYLPLLLKKCPSRSLFLPKLKKWCLIRVHFSQNFEHDSVSGSGTERKIILLAFLWFSLDRTIRKMPRHVQFHVRFRFVAVRRTPEVAPDPEYRMRLR